MTNALLKKSLASVLERKGFVRAGKAWRWMAPGLVVVVNLEAMSGVQIANVRVGFWFLEAEQVPEKLMAHQCHAAADLSALVHEGGSEFAKQFVLIEGYPDYSHDLTSRLDRIQSLGDDCISRLIEGYCSIDLLRERYAGGDLRSAALMKPALDALT